MLLQGFERCYLGELFAYDRASGLITRRVGRSRESAGAIVGTRDGKGYLHVSVDKVFVRLHRLAWFLETGETPERIDHVNRNRQDNRWANLRELSHIANCGNTWHRHNTSGFKGVSKNTRSGKWHAQIKIAGKQTYLGRFDTPEEAARCYDKAALQHFGPEAYINRV